MLTGQQEVKKLPDKNLIFNQHLLHLLKRPLDERFNFLTARYKWFYLAVRATRSMLHFAVTTRPQDLAVTAASNRLCKGPLKFTKKCCKKHYKI